MGTKGQIFTLDFVISMVLVILAFGLVLNFMELNGYNMQEREMGAELKTMGDSAADILVSSPAIVCELGYYGSEIPRKWHRISYLMNCMMPRHSLAPMRINRTILGLGIKDKNGKYIYGCHVSLSPAVNVPPGTVPLEIGTDNCDSGAQTYLGQKNYYSVKRKVVVPTVAPQYNSAWSMEDNQLLAKRLEKKDFADLANKSATIEITLTVWRND